MGERGFRRGGEGQDERRVGGIRRGRVQGEGGLGGGEGGMVV